jgi:hypothetical protein
MRLVTVCCFLALALAGCGAAPEPRRAPDLRGQRLDKAQDRLDDLGLRYDTSGGLVVVRYHWRVCDQTPRPGTRTTHVHLYVCREDDD